MTDRLRWRGGATVRTAIWTAIASMGLAALAAGPVRADDAGPAYVGPDGFDGTAIYERVVANRFRSFAQTSTLISADRSGRSQKSTFEMMYQDFRSENGDSDDGVLSKALVKYTHPFDLRFAGYLIQSNAGRANDQFVYYPSRRRVVRVNLRNQAVYGTDFSFEDVVPREAEDFQHKRLPDAVVDGVPTFRVRLYPEEIAESEYSKIDVYVDKQRFVVLRARYWDDAGVEIKEFYAPPAALRSYEGVWVPMEATMKNLLLETQTMLVISELEANPEFDDRTFDVGRLESH